MTSLVVQICQRKVNLKVCKKYNGMRLLSIPGTVYGRVIAKRLKRLIKIIRWKRGEERGLLWKVEDVLMFTGTNYWHKNT